MVNTLDIDVTEQIRSMASITAKYLGHYKSLPGNCCGYEAFFENHEFRINDACSGTGDCNTAAETKIMYQNKLVYHKQEGKIKAYVAGIWEDKLEKLHSKVGF